MSDASSRLERIEDRLIRQGETLVRIDVTLEAQHESLKEHMSRTKTNETAIRRVQYLVVVLLGIGGAEKLGVLSKILSFFI